MLYHVLEVNLGQEHELFVQSSYRASSILSFAGPETWSEKFPLAKNGVRQSPVNIVTSKTLTGKDLSVNPLRWTYISENTKCLVNPGYCWRVDVNGKGSELTGGPLNNDIFLVNKDLNAFESFLVHSIEQSFNHKTCFNLDRSNNSIVIGAARTVADQSTPSMVKLIQENCTLFTGTQQSMARSKRLPVIPMDWVNIWSFFLFASTASNFVFCFSRSWRVLKGENWQNLLMIKIVSNSWLYRSLKVGKQHEELDQIARLMPFISHKGDRVSLELIDHKNS